jgi:hypothetical protein
MEDLYDEKVKSEANNYLALLNKSPEELLNECEQIKNTKNASIDPNMYHYSRI